MDRKRRWPRTRLEPPRDDRRVGSDLLTGRLRVITWESEVRAIAGETTRWTVETGGDLFGRWNTTPTIHLATRAGPGAVRDRAHFRLDVDYVRALSELLAAHWGLRYFGDWHSHHRLGLREPSSGDRQRINRLAGRNAFGQMFEIIATLEPVDRAPEPIVRLHPWAYWIQDGQAELAPARLDVAPGVSPIREALVARGVLPEQDFGSWSEVPVTRIRAGADSDPLVPSGPAVVEPAITHRALASASEALVRASGGPVERHVTPFGWVLAAPVDEWRFVGIAVGRRWPHEILEVDWIDRRRQTSKPLALELPASILTPESLGGVYQRARDLVESEGVSSDVDDGAAGTPLPGAPTSAAPGA